MYDFRDMRIAVLGDSLEGLYLAYMMAKDRYEIHLFPSSVSPSFPLLLTASTLRTFLFFSIFEEKFEKWEIPSLVLESPGGEILEVPQPGLFLFSRLEVENFLREKAEEAGVFFHPSLVREPEEAKALSLHTELGTQEVDFLIQTEVTSFSLFPCSPRYTLLLWSFFKAPVSQKAPLRLSLYSEEKAILWWLPSPTGWYILLLGFGGKSLRPRWGELLVEQCLTSLGHPPEKVRELWLPWVSPEQIPSYALGPYWASLGNAVGGGNPFLLFSSDFPLWSAHYFCDSFAKMRPTMYGELLKEFVEKQGSLPLWAPYLENSSLVNFFFSFFKNTGILPFFAQYLRGEQSLPEFWEKLQKNRLRHLWQFFKHLLW